MKINILTLTGADNTVTQSHIFAISEQFPFAEWGILLSKSAEGKNRFPTTDWIVDLMEMRAIMVASPKFSGHLCGRWVRDICAGDWSFLDEREDIISLFQRFQLNFHSYLHKIKDMDRFVEGFKDARLKDKQFIFQLDDVNNEILDIAQKNEIDAAGLFDTSGGAGVLPKDWPKSRREYCGYAGGLGPQNLREQMEALDKVVGDRTVWVDMETHIRCYETDNFDYDKCVQCLEIGQEWVDG